MERVSRPNRPERCDLLLEAGTLVTLDPSRPVIESGSVAIEGERIVAVGPQDEVSMYRPDRVISCRGRLVVPGLVDCHNHLFQSLGRTLGEGLPGCQWLSRFMWPYAAEISRRRRRRPCIWARWRRHWRERPRCSTTTTGAPTTTPPWPWPARSRT